MEKVYFPEEWNDLGKYIRSKQPALWQIIQQQNMSYEEFRVYMNALLGTNVQQTDSMRAGAVKFLVALEKKGKISTIILPENYGEMKQ